MTIREFIKEKMKKIFDELHTQLSEQRNLKSRLSAKSEQLGNTDYGNKAWDELQFRIDTIEDANRKLVKSRNIAKNFGDIAEQLQITSEQNKISGNRGNTILESCFREINDALETVHRQTTVNGKKYSYQETRIGKQDEEGYAKVVEGFENGEQTYYSIESEGGPSEEMQRYLGYETIIVGSETGIPMYENRRNPDKDTIIRTSYDYENGKTISQESALCNSKGKKIGKYNRVQRQNINSLDPEEAIKENTVIERTFIGKDGKEITYKSVIEDTGRGVFKRKDYQNGELVTEAIMNMDNDTMRVSNYKDGKMVNSSHFNSFSHGNWGLDEKNSFVYDEYGDKKKSDEITDEDKRLMVASNPYYMSDEKDEYQQKKAIFFEQTSFLDSAYISDELRDFMQTSDFARGLNYTSAENILNNNSMRELKEKQQKREVGHSKESKEVD